MASRNIDLMSLCVGCKVEFSRRILVVVIRVQEDLHFRGNSAGPFPVLLGASPYQKSLRHLPPVLATFPFIEYGPMQLYLDDGYAYVAMDTPGMGRSEGVWDPVSRTEGEAIHDMIEQVAGLD